MALSLLEDYKRYDESLIWRIHRSYFFERGIQAWSKGEVPYSGLSSYEEAYKKARLFADNLQQGPKTVPVRVLELGAGYGEFARNFLKAFAQICNQEGLPYYEQLEYYVSDFSETNIRELANSGRLRTYGTLDLSSRIKFALYDALDKNSLMDAETHLGLSEHRFDLILANYVLDQFKVRIFVRSQSLTLAQSSSETASRYKYFEKYLALYDKPQHIALYHKRKKLKSISKPYQYRELDLEDELEPKDFQILNSCFRAASSSAVSYPYEALLVLQNCLALLKPSGVIICSDFNSSSKAGFDPLEPCYYANSLAEGVNFEFLSKYFQDQEFYLLYEDPIHPLHTFILTRPEFNQRLELGEIYRQVYLGNGFLRLFYKILREFYLGAQIYVWILIMSTLYFLFFAPNS